MTAKQRLTYAIKLAKTHPDWTGRQILATAGYRGYTLDHPSRVFNRPTAKAIEADVMSRAKAKTFELLTPEQMAERRVALAMQDEERSVAARTLEGIMVDCGVIEARDRLTIVNAVRVDMGRDVMELLAGILTEQQGVEFATRLTEAKRSGHGGHAVAALPVEAETVETAAV